MIERSQIYRRMNSSSTTFYYHKLWWEDDGGRWIFQFSTINTSGKRSRIPERAIYSHGDAEAIVRIYELEPDWKGVSFDVQEKFYKKHNIPK